MMDTHRRGTAERVPASYFAPAALASQRELQAAIGAVDGSPVLDAILRSIGGVLAVLNEERQVLAVNGALLECFDLEDADRVLGLRPGEVIQCVHARDHPGGCGTSRFCATCGLAIALVTSEAQGRPEERICVATVRRGAEELDISLRVRASPLRIGGRPVTLLILQDISAEVDRASLERVFLHDLSNLVMGLYGACESTAAGTIETAASSLETVRSLARRLAGEVSVQRILSHAEPDEDPCTLESLSLARVVAELRATLAEHPVAEGRYIEYPRVGCEWSVRTDRVLLLRVLTNMLVNACEASEPGDVVRCWFDRGRGELTIAVWNRQAIPEEIAGRIFQRRFSTKSGPGRGMGTYAMKLLGERYLKGHLEFTSSPAEGTTFFLRLPEGGEDWAVLG